MCLKKNIETLQLKLKRAKGIKAQRVQKATGGIKVAFEHMAYSSAAVSRKHNISRDSVRRWPMKYSIAWNNAQDQMLRHAVSSVQQAVQGGRRLMVVVEKSKWDEAKHTFSMAVDESASGVERMSWSVMRHRMWIGYWLTGVDDGGQYEQHYVEVVLPPVLMLGSNNAGCL